MHCYHLFTEIICETVLLSRDMWSAGLRSTFKVSRNDNNDSLLHIFALKMNYNMFTLAIRKNIKIYTFLKSILGLGLEVRCEKLQLLLELLRNLKI